MGNVMMEASQINYRGGETKMSVEQALKETSGEAAAIAALQAAVGNLQTGKADLPVIAPEFDAETGVYAVGDLVMYQGKLYEFTTAHETAGDWNSTEVTEKTVSDEIDSLKSGLTNIKAGVVEVTAESTAYGYATVSVPYGNTNYSVVLTVGYAANFTEAVLAVNTKTDSDVRVGFFNKSNASLTLPINYVIIPNN